jgi:RNA-dependent RNA polymerase
LGYKGVVGVDEQLDGIKMRLRGSMNKFKGTQAELEEAEIEIARAFDYPNISYLNRPLIMVLEDRSVKKEDFITLQESAVADARMIDDSIEQFRKILNSHSLGTGFHLSFLMKRLNDLRLDLRSPNPAQTIDNAFFARLRRVAMNHVLRDIKHSARIPVPKSYQLVGIADEGPAYQNMGYENVYVLPPNKIYACIQNPGDEEPTWLKGQCMISRSPVVHPGDVQRVFAIGKPPDDKLCLFRHMKNVVVFPSVGPRSLASCLAGGDLDGDIYDVIQYGPLLATTHVSPASYPKGSTRTLPDGQESTVEDICDFIVEYINSDVLGLLSVRHLIIADQSKLGTLDPSCMRLAELCSQAVDYPKNGIPVDIDNPPIPRTLIRCKPDWQAAEVVNPRGTDYYTSSRALGELYRGITIADPENITEETISQGALDDPISRALKPYILSQIHPYTDPDGRNQHIREVFQRYSDELGYICAVHTLSDTPGVRLLEEEIVIGTILAKCAQHRWRKDRTYRMRVHVSVIVQEVQRELLEQTEEASTAELVEGLEQAWAAWHFSLRYNMFPGTNSFGLVALGVIFECLEKLGALDEIDKPKNDD